MTAAMAVLGGVDADVVAARTGVGRSVVDGWVAAFVEAGRGALVHGGSPDVGAPRGEDPGRDRYLGLVAHELRSPLTMIQGWVDVLRDGDGTAEERAQALDAVEVQVRGLRRLADDALDATRVALGRLDLHLSSADLGASVTAAVDGRPGSVIPVTVHSPGLVVRIDAMRFGQILHNLLDNARTHGTGQPAVAVRRTGAFGEVVITSPGRPIDPDLARLLFEPFERGRTTGQGVGLGLYVCRSLTAAHGGQIGLRVDEGGNHFWLRLPLDGVGG